MKTRIYEFINKENISYCHYSGKENNLNFKKILDVEIFVTNDGKPDDDFYVPWIQVDKQKIKDYNSFPIPISGANIKIEIVSNNQHFDLDDAHLLYNSRILPCSEGF